jgi:dsRNA-specific ribonuclease
MFVAEFINVLAKCSELSFAERQYIEQLGKQAYNLTVAQYVIEEFPELETELLNKSNAN